MRRLLPLLLLAAFAAPALAAPGGAYYELTYPPSKAEGELAFGVTFVVWIPDGVKELRGVIVHQHGCGEGACKGGATAAYDLHWQALAKKHGCALLGPSYHQKDKDNCRLWCDPRKGSEKAFLNALADLGKKAKRPELDRVPWCLWGHSGGGYWASLMHAKFPERCVGVWYRSGTAFATWGKGDVPAPELTPAVYKVPIVLNPGFKEKGDKRFAGAWTGAEAMFDAYRKNGSPAAFAPDPRTAHECGDSRYLAIPFFDACLRLRLPEKAGGKLREIKAVAVGDSLLPDAATAKAFAEYVKTGYVIDATPPPAPTNVKAARKPKDGVELTWEAEADLEGGLAGFVIERDGKEVARLPEKPVGRFGKALFQQMSYHDTPEKPLPVMRWTDRKAPIDTMPTYRVIAVNTSGLRSEPAKAR